MSRITSTAITFHALLDYNMPRGDHVRTKIYVGTPIACLGIGDRLVAIVDVPCSGAARLVRPATHFILSIPMIVVPRPNHQSYIPAVPGSQRFGKVRRI